LTYTKVQYEIIHLQSIIIISCSILNQSTTCFDVSFDDLWSVKHKDYLDGHYCV